MSLLLFFFMLGLAIGSFLNVVIERGEQGKSLTGRSHCDTCHKTLSWRELIPLVSFVRQKGRCAHCSAVLSLQYPLMELGTGLVFAFVGWYVFYATLTNSSLEFFLIACIFLVAASAMIVIIVADFNYHIIPNGATLLLALLGVAAVMVRNNIVRLSSNMVHAPVSWSGALWDLAASIGAVLFFFCLWHFSKGRAMGFGDVKLIGATSLALGFPLSLVAVLFAFWIGGLAGVVMLLLRARGLKSEIAFGPFIIIGTILAFLFGHAFLLYSGFAYVF